MELLPQLHRHAETFARQLGCGGFNTSAAETDFLGYLGTVTGHDYPPWGARASWFQYINDMTQQSGTGNPLSPLIVVGSEFNAESDDYYELYLNMPLICFGRRSLTATPAHRWWNACIVIFSSFGVELVNQTRTPVISMLPFTRC